MKSAVNVLKCQPKGLWLAKVSDLRSANPAREAYTFICEALALEAFTNKDKTHSNDRLSYHQGGRLQLSWSHVVNAQFPEKDLYVAVHKSPVAQNSSNNPTMC